MNLTLRHVKFISFCVQITKHYGFEQNRISIVVNIPYNQLVEMLGKATIGLHTMIDEHFGITVVEFMVGEYLQTDCGSSS